MICVWESLLPPSNQYSLLLATVPPSSFGVGWWCVCFGVSWPHRQQCLLHYVLNHIVVEEHRALKLMNLSPDIDCLYHYIVFQCKGMPFVQNPTDFKYCSMNSAIRCLREKNSGYLTDLWSRDFFYDKIKEQTRGLLYLLIRSINSASDFICYQCQLKVKQTSNEIISLWEIVKKQSLTLYPSTS